MNSDRIYIEEKAAAPSSDFALVRLFAPEALRPSLTALHALYNELMNVAYTVNDPGVAAAKLSWWREAVGRAFKGQAQHPVLQALQADMEARRLNRGELQEMVEGALENVDPEAFADDASLDAFCRRTGGLRARSEARLAGAGDEGMGAATRLGAASAQTMLLHLMPRDLPRGRLFLPQDALARHQVTRAQLQEGSSANRAVTELIREQATRGSEALAAAARTVPAADAGALRHLLAQAALDRSRLRRIYRAGARALREAPAFGPLNRLFVAWRAAGKAQRRFLARDR